jgi:hypothetical protein
MIKLEIIDNQICNCYEYRIYKYVESKFWGLVRPKYVFFMAHRIGYNYMCPEIYKGKITVKEMFDKEVQDVIKNNDIRELHTTIINKRN